MARRLLLALWAGALVSVGALVTPALFSLLPERRLAGVVAGELFRRLTWVSVAAALALALLALWSGQGAAGRRLALWSLAPAALLLASEFAVRPLLAAARLAVGAGGSGFAAWHGLATALYGLASVIVVGLLVQANREGR